MTSVIPRISILGVVLLAAALTVLWPAEARTERNPNPGVRPPNSRPYGMTYTEWAVEWFQWAFSIPADQSPFLDPDGRFSQVNQSGPVFFLGNNFGGTTVRSSTVPVGKSLFFSPGGFFGLLGFDADTEDELRTFVEEGLATLANVRADVDGVPLQSLDSYIVVTPLFSFTLPEDNIFDLPPGEYQGVLGGVFLMLTRLLSIAGREPVLRTDILPPVRRGEEFHAY